MNGEITTRDDGQPCAKPEHEQFAQRFAATGNALASYRATYPDASDATARSKASPLTRHPDVRRRVLELQKARREQILRETADLEALVANMAIGRAAELVDADGRPVPIQELPAHVKAVISGLEIELDDEGRVSKYKLKLPDPLQAARLLAQLRGALVERKDLTSGGRPLQESIELPEDAPLEVQNWRRSRAGLPPIDAEYEDVTPDDEPPPDDCSDLL